MATTQFISHARLQRFLEYDEMTGVFAWRKDRGGRKFDGEPAGSLDANGYITITVCGNRFFAHRLAWFYLHRKWPQQYIDHINGNRSDNRIANLRDVSCHQNCQNISLISKNNATGVTGVSVQGKKYRAELQFQGARYDLGMFSTIEEAGKAYVAAKVRLNDAPLLRL